MVLKSPSSSPSSTPPTAYYPLPPPLGMNTAYKRITVHELIQGAALETDIQLEQLSVLHLEFLSLLSPPSSLKWRQTHNWSNNLFLLIITFVFLSMRNITEKQANGQVKQWLFLSITLLFFILFFIHTVSITETDTKTDNWSKACFLLSVVLHTLVLLQKQTPGAKPSSNYCWLSLSSNTWSKDHQRSCLLLY